MKKLLALSLFTLVCVSFLPIARARTAASDQAEIRQLLDRWGKAFRAKDINGIMSIYAPGDTLVGFDIVRCNTSDGMRTRKTTKTSLPSTRVHLISKSATCMSPRATTLPSSLPWNESVEP